MICGLQINSHYGELPLPFSFADAMLRERDLLLRSHPGCQAFFKSDDSMFHCRGAVNKNGKCCYQTGNFRSYLLHLENNLISQLMHTTSKKIHREMVDEQRLFLSYHMLLKAGVIRRMIQVDK